MTKRLALAFGTRDRVELSERSIEPLIHEDIDLWIVDGSTTEKGREFAEAQTGRAHVRANVHGGSDAWIAYGLTLLLNETDSPYVGLCENDVLLHKDWFAPTMALFARGSADSMEVGAVSARCYEDRILCQRDGYALVHNLGAGHIIFTREAAWTVLDHFRTSWTTENRRVFQHLSGLDIAKWWAFRGGQHMITADWGFERMLAAHGLASLALTPSDVEMIGQVPPLHEQGLTIAKQPVELLRNDAAFDLFAERTRQIRNGYLQLPQDRFLRLDDQSQVIFPHQIGALGGQRYEAWRLKWSQGFGPFAFVASAPGSQIVVPVAGACSFFVSGGERGGKFDILDKHSGYQATPELPPEGDNKQVMNLAVPGSVAWRPITLTAQTAGVVFYGIKVNEPQPVVPDWSFEHTQLPLP